MNLKWVLTGQISGTVVARIIQPKRLSNFFVSGHAHFYTLDHRIPTTQGKQIHRPGSSSAQLRTASNSAIKHLITGTSTTLSLYDELPSSSASTPSDLAKSYNATLVNLVANGKIGAAERLRLQLVEQGIPINPHPIYEQAVVANLRWRDLDKCIFYLATWFSLVPDYEGDVILSSKSSSSQGHNPHPLGPFRAIRHALLESGKPSARLPLVMKFGLLCVSKGYMQPMLDEIVPLVVRFAGRDAGAEWLHDVERMGVQYRLVKCGGRDVQEASKWLRVSSVEICCQMGWLLHAVAIVAFHREYTLPMSMYKLLVRALKDAGMVDELEVVKKNLNRDVLQPRSLHSRDFAPAPFRFASLPSSIPLPHHHTRIARQKVAIQARLLKSQLHKRSHANNAHRSIVKFLSDLKAVGGAPRLVTWLRHRALSSDDETGQIWIRAELSYHNLEWNYGEILQLCMRYLDIESRPWQLPGAFGSTLRQIMAAREWSDGDDVDSECVGPRVFIKSRDRWPLLRAVINLAVDLPEPLAKINTLYEAYLTDAVVPAGKGTTTAAKNQVERVRVTRHELGQVLSAFVAAFAECGSVEDARRVLLTDLGDAALVSRLVENVWDGILASDRR